jgi:AcrR family transcriptional regulator
MFEQRRIPKQQRSRERVERIMDATAAIVAKVGDEGLTIRTVADESGMPEATIYRYFADRDEICAAFLDREMEKLDLAVAEAFAALEQVSLRSMVETSMFAHLHHHQAHPETVRLWFGSPRSPVVDEHVRKMDKRMGVWLRAVVDATGMVRSDAPEYRLEMFIRLGDRALEFVLTSDLSKEEQDDTIAHYCDALASYFERFATKAGIEGIPTADFLAALGENPVHFDAEIA